MKKTFILFLLIIKTSSFALEYDPLNYDSSDGCWDESTQTFRRNIVSTYTDLDKVLTTGDAECTRIILPIILNNPQLEYNFKGAEVDFMLISAGVMGVNQAFYQGSKIHNLYTGFYMITTGQFDENTSIYSGEWDLIPQIFLDKDASSKPALCKHIDEGISKKIRCR